MQILQRMGKYIYQQAEWPLFYWDNEPIIPLLSKVRYLQGRLIGKVESIGVSLRTEATLDTFSLDVIKSAEIEGEHFKPQQVRSSVASKLGFEQEGNNLSDRNADGMIEMLLDAAINHEDTLSHERLFSWHKGLFPKASDNLITGAWRKDLKGRMNVVSGAIGKERIHFTAPKAEALDFEMDRFIEWINTDSKLDLVLKSAVAHFWFVTIHPFQDGNGRIGRAISDWLLSKADSTPHRYYSMSAQICAEKDQYYYNLEHAQSNSLDITEWMVWYLNCLKNAILASDELLNHVLFKADFWQKNAQLTLNDRQIKVLSRLLNGFDGALTSEKWMKLAKCSKDSAIRDINDLIKKGVLSKSEAAGKNTSYNIA